jgi:hypothetical protein
MWLNFFKIGRILSQVWPEGLAVIWQQWHCYQPAENSAKTQNRLNKILIGQENLAAVWPPNLVKSGRKHMLTREIGG